MGNVRQRRTRQSTVNRSRRNVPALEQSVGAAIRRLRDARRISLRTLASKCGFSASFISQVELNQASPSLASLERLAHGLGVTIGQLFQDAEPTTPPIVRTFQRPMLQSGWSHSQIELLGPPGIGHRLEALLITIRPRGSSGGRLHAHETELFTIVFAGEVQLQIQETTQVLRRGDAITIPSGMLHRWENKSARDVQLIKVIPRLAH